MKEDKIKKTKKETTALEQSLKDESSDRKKILKEVNNNLDSYSFKIIEYENRIRKYELMEIKYNNLEREIEEKTKMYENIIDDLKQQNQHKESEIFEVKKETINSESKITALKSIVELVINDYGIDYVSKVSGLSIDTIKKYLQN